MKRLLLTIACMAAVIPLHSEKVSSQRAARVASAFFIRNDPATRSVAPELDLVWDGEEPSVTRSSSASPAVYVFNRRGGGFVIVSGDDSVRPILGFSFENDFRVDGMPSGLKWYMDYLKAWCRNVSVPDADAASAWESYADTRVYYSDEVDYGSEYTAVRTNQWNQYYPYYIKAPTQNGYRCPTGCLPLALAEVLTFFATQKDEYKVTGDGSTVGGYDTDGAYVESYTLNSVYLWDEFCLFPTSSISEEAQNSLAQLILDCGTLLKATYTQNGTAASELDVIHAFGDHMGYNKAARFERPEHYTKSQWLSMLKSEMDAGRPLLYNGGYHAFVADGYATYNDELVIHFNFGYGGTGNGYYFYPHIDANYNDYSTGQSAIFDFYPSSTGSYRFEGLYLVDTGNDYNGVMMAYYGDNSYWGGAFGIKTISSSYTGRADLSIVDKNGNCVKSSIKSVNLNGYASTNAATSMAGNFTFAPHFGYRGILQYTDDKGDLVSAKGPVDGSIVVEAPLMPAAFIKTESSYNLGDCFTLTLVNNNYAFEGTKYTTVWTLTKPNGNEVTYGTSQREVYLGARGEWTIKATVKSVSDGSIKETIVAKINVK